jgi:hypothetical protein
MKYRIFIILFIISLIACKDKSGDNFIGTWIATVDYSGTKDIDTAYISNINESDEYILSEHYQKLGDLGKYKGILKDDKLLFTQTSFANDGKVEFEFIKSSRHIIATDSDGIVVEFTKVK